MQGRSMSYFGGAIVWRVSARLLVTAVVALLVCQTAVARAAEDGAAGAPPAKEEAGARLATFEDLVSLFKPSLPPEAVLGIPDLFRILVQSPIPEEAIDRAYRELVALGAKDLSTPPAPTGDKLFDRYAMEVDKRLNTSGSANAADVPEDVLATWEADFGNDPRYWELRYFCASGIGRPTTAGGASAEDSLTAHKRRVDFLLDAQRRGVASCNTMLLLYREVRGEHNEQLDMAGIPSDAEPQQQVDALALMRRFEDEEVAFLNDVIERWPDYAWAYYDRAMYWFELGEEQRGLSDLAAGNVAPNLRLPQPWPYQYVVDGIHKGAIPGSIPVSGAICEAQSALASPNYIMMKEHLKEAFVACNLDGGMQRFEAWHQFGCRLASSAPELPIQGLVGVLLVGMASGYLEENAAQDLAPGQIETLQRIRGAYTEYKAHFQQAHLTDVDELSALATAGLARGAACHCLLGCRRELKLSDDLAPIISDLAQVHYPDLALPECMKKYEAMTKERAMQYRKEQAGTAAADGE